MNFTLLDLAHKLSTMFNTVEELISALKVLNNSSGGAVFSNAHWPNNTYKNPKVDIDFVREVMYDRVVSRHRPNGHKITAIKEFRMLALCGLKEAKEEIDRIW